MHVPGLKPNSQLNRHILAIKGARLKAYMLATTHFCATITVPYSSVSFQLLLESYNISKFLFEWYNNMSVTLYGTKRHIWNSEDFASCFQLDWIVPRKLINNSSVPSVVIFSDCVSSLHVNTEYLTPAFLSVEFWVMNELQMVLSWTFFLGPLFVWVFSNFNQSTGVLRFELWALKLSVTVFAFNFF